MSETKFTPGPWSVAPHKRWDKRILIIGPACEVDFDDVDQSTQEANALLISAAPDLLEALRGMVDALNSGLIAYNTSPADQGFKAKADAAITKATQPDKEGE